MAKLQWQLEFKLFPRSPYFSYLNHSDIFLSSNLKRMVAEKKSPCRRPILNQKNNRTNKMVSKSSVYRSIRWIEELYFVKRISFFFQTTHNFLSTCYNEFIFLFLYISLYLLLASVCLFYEPT